MQSRRHDRSRLTAVFHFCKESQAGATTGQTTEPNPLEGNSSLVWQGGSPANFELRASFRLIAKNDKNFANSGIYYRSRVDAQLGRTVYATKYAAFVCRRLPG